MKFETITIASTFKAMNTTIEVLIYPRLNREKPGIARVIRQRAEAAAGKVQQLFIDAEARLSRFLPESELSLLNQRGYLENVSPLLYGSIEQAVKMGQLTGGVFDPTILKALKEAGYDRSFELIGHGELAPAFRYTSPSFSNYRGIELDPATRSIRLPRGTQIDLGGIAKGMTVDRAARLLKQEQFLDFMVSGGGDMLVSGRMPGEKEGWRIGVLNPLTLEGNLTELAVQGGGVATSAVTKRRWYSGGQSRNHLIDPRSGQPVENGIAAVTALAPNAQLADVMAKTALILGPVEGMDFIEQQPGCAALFVTHEGQILRSKNLRETLEHVA